MRTRRERIQDRGAEINNKITALNGALLFVLLGLVGLTLPLVHKALWVHIFLGMLIVPPILLKLVTTGYRFFSYYMDRPAYKRRGPPNMILRLLAPFVVALTVIVIASGIALVLVPPRERLSFLFIHRASFVLWFGSMTIHVLGHIVETLKVSMEEWLGKSPIRGFWFRASLVISSAIIGLLVALWFLPYGNGWFL
ncbi:MAG: hypothetical protein HKL80_07055 [Acidimicrobiales bacterium]|nr:hypothetical protein [Acidimicrobiales bacterium]